MFIGHYAIGMASKKIIPKVSLGTLFLAVQLVDLLWPLFLLIGIEHVRIDPGNTVVTPLDFYDYPFTHSLLGAMFWSCAFGILYVALKKDKRSAMVVGLAVFSHWILDFITHRPDLPLSFGGTTYLGLGLWNSLPATLIVEVGLFAAGIVLYLRSTRAKDKIGSIGFWSMIAVITLAYVGNLAGPPPPSASAIAIAGNASWLIVLWAYWVDKHRTTATADGS